MAPVALSWQLDIFSSFFPLYHTQTSLSLTFMLSSGDFSAPISFFHARVHPVARISPSRHLRDAFNLFKFISIYAVVSFLSPPVERVSGCSSRHTCWQLPTSQGSCGGETRKYQEKSQQITCWSVRLQSSCAHTSLVESVVLNAGAEMWGKSTMQRRSPFIVSLVSYQASPVSSEQVFPPQTCCCFWRLMHVQRCHEHHNFVIRPFF